MIKKTVQRSEDCFVQFTEEELSQLNIKAGDKFSCEIEDNSVVLKKFASIDIDISEWSREVLEMLISDSIEKDISVNDVICNIVENHIQQIDV
jgi:hypothetical protein